MSDRRRPKLQANRETFDVGKRQLGLEVGGGHCPETGRTGGDGQEWLVWKNSFPADRAAILVSRIAMPIMLRLHDDRG